MTYQLPSPSTRVRKTKRLMEKKQVKILEEFAPDLRSSLNLMYLLPHLMKRRLLTASEEQKLKSQVKTDHDINSEFLDCLKTKGSRAFALFLAALRGEKEHLGHVDLCERMSRCAERVGIRISLEALPESMETSLSAGVDNYAAHSQSMSHSEPATRRESLDSSVSSPIARVFDDSFIERIEKTQNSIVQRLDQMEKEITKNHKELENLTKICEELKFLIKLRPGSRGSRPGSSGMEADLSSDGSEISMPPIQKTRKHRKVLPHRNTWPALISQSDSSIHSTQEEATSLSIVGEESYSALALSTGVRPFPPLVPASSRNVCCYKYC